MSVTRRTHWAELSALFAALCLSGLQHLSAQTGTERSGAWHAGSGFSHVHTSEARGVFYTRLAITFAVAQVGDVVLDFRGTSVSTLLANGTALPGGPAAGWNSAHLTVPQSTMRMGANRVEVAFTTPIAAAGASIIRTRDVTDGREYLYTLLVPSDAHLLLPCFDQPDLKARLTLSLTTPVAWSALGNGPLRERDSTATVITHRFGETRPLSTYLMAFAAGPTTQTT